MNTSDNKNLILAMVLMLAVWFGFTIFFPPAKESNVATNPASESAPVAELSADKAAAPVVASSQPQMAQTAEQVQLVKTVENLPAREISVETDKYIATFTTAGARLTSFELKDYRTTAEEDASLVQMFQPGPLSYATLRTTGTEGFALASDDVFDDVSAESLLVSGASSKQLIFKRTTATGVQISKIYTFSGNDYSIETNLLVHNTSTAQIRGALDFSLIMRWDDSLKPDSYTFAGPASMVKDKIDEVDVDDLEEGSVAYGSNVAWSSFQTKYFISVVAPAAGVSERVQIIRKGDAIENVLESPHFTLSPGESRQLDYFVFIGPKEMEQLKAAGHRLEEVIHFGFFDILAKPLFVALTFFYGYIQNYGFAIILLTVLIKLIFWPLTHKSYSSMKSMQKLQPEMQKLREKFGSDKERMNKELMTLYKTHKVNPLGGCLPMLVQIPVFFALYKVLLDSIALRHAPFAFWLTDLSAKDPYYITPVLMGISMFFQQKMTPTTADPMQAKIFMMMPVIFTFLFLNFPCGLVIYWLVNNLLTIVQQYYIHRKAA